LESGLARGAHWREGGGGRWQRWEWLLCDLVGLAQRHASSLSWAVPRFLQHTPLGDCSIGLRRRLNPVKLHLETLSVTPALTMADCENRGGRDPIPPTLYITVIIMIIASFAILVTSFKKGWMQYNLVDSEMMQESHKVPTLAHGLYRWVVAAWSFGIIMYAVHLGRESDVPGWDLRYFTVWNYTTFCVLFILLSLEHVFTYVPRWVSCLSWTLFQVELANAIFLDIVFWAILFPRQHDTEMPRFFITVNVHLVNSVLMLGEVFLGKLLLVPGQIVHLPPAAAYL